MQRWLKVTIGIISSFIILLIIGGIIVHKLLISSVPNYTGEIASDKISEDIKIYRDSTAVPYIIAQTDNDAAFALGYVHAQDRLFSMDLIRRAGEGKLSEIIGPKTIPFDKMFITIGIENTASNIVSRLDPQTLKLLQSYCDGINLYIKQARGNYPVEFDILEYDPELWKPVDCVVIDRMMAWELNMSWWTKFALLDLSQKFGYEKAKELIPSYPENAPNLPTGQAGIISQDYKLPFEQNEGKHFWDSGVAFMKTDKDFRKFLGWTGSHIGSNNWVVNGNMSVSGKPVIANDTHLAYSAPGRWYTASIITPDMNVTGFTMPGAPGVIIGENGNVAWALTNIMEDDADFYSEKIDSTGDKYFYEGDWHDLKISKKIIKVKDSSSVNFEIKYTAHGPIISDIHPYSFAFPNKNLNIAVISMHWLGNYISNEILTFYKIDKAKNWSDFKEALNTYCLPGQKFVYADKEGNIGYLFGAKLPVRPSNSLSFIYDGTNGNNNWAGFVPEDDLPQLFNPPQNYIASANNKIMKDFKYYISNLWEPSSRIERITQLLNSKQKHSVNDFKKYQMDFTSPYAEKICKYILNAFSTVKATDANLKTALKLLELWEFNMDKYIQAPAIYSEFLRQLMKNVFYNTMGQDLYNEYVLVQNIPLRTIMQLMDNPESFWFDDPSTGQKEVRDVIIRKSLADALRELETKYGSDPADWQWGKIHHVLFRHPFHGISQILDNVIDIGPYEIGGDGTTVFNTEYAFTIGIENYPQFKHGEFENYLGPAMRYIYDFSKPDEINLILTTGESGNVMSAHYSDMTNLWLNGKYLKLKTNLSSIENPANKLFVIKAR